MLKSAVLKLIHDLYYSFTNTKNKGFSARKLSAFAGVVAGFHETSKIESDLYRFYAVCVWLVFSLLCLAVITGEQLIKLKSEKSEKFGDTNNPNSGTPAE